LDKYNYSLNDERLKRYKSNAESTKEDILNNYLWNIRLSKELYSLIALTEVTLRNHMNNAINSKIREKWLLDKNFVKTFLKDKEIERYIDVYNDFSKKGTLTEGKLIAELSLGFWVNLFNKKYKVSLWHKKEIFETVFPYFDLKVHKRISYIYPKLKELQYIRNRISHHEAIFDSPKGLNNCYREFLLLLGWLSPEIKEMAINVCKFEEVWRERRVTSYAGEK